MINLDIKEILSLVSGLVVLMGWFIRLESKILWNEQKIKKLEIDLGDIHKEVLATLKVLQKEAEGTRIEVKIALDRIEHLNRRSISIKARELKDLIDEES